MTREEAARVLTELADEYEKYEISKDGWLKTTYIPAHRMGVVALRGPEPDPDTGLVPCGCGGKAQMGKLLYTGNDPDLMPDLMTEYYAYCQDCGITTDNSTDMERVENEWNTAMGYTAPPLPGAIGPDAGDMDPNGEEGAKE